jgi:hypothetical protein
LSTGILLLALPAALSRAAFSSTRGRQFAREVLTGISDNLPIRWMIDCLDAGDAGLERGMMGLRVPQEAQLRDAGANDQNAPLSFECQAGVIEKPNVVVRVLVDSGQSILGMTMHMILSRRMDRRFGDRVYSKREDSRLVAVNPNDEVTHLCPPSGGARHPASTASSSTRSVLDPPA